MQIEAGPIGEILDELREKLDPWLGEPVRKRSEGRVALTYRFEATSRPVRRMRLKIEINTREHFSVLGLNSHMFRVEKPWFSGEASVRVYGLEELLGTKLRALYQRKKGRDLHDLWLALSEPDIQLDAKKVAACFERYVEHANVPITRAQFEANLAAKLEDPAFVGDLGPLLREEIAYDAAKAAALVREKLLSLLPGEPWKGERSDR